MADITSLTQGEVEDCGQVNWRGDQVNLPQGGQSIYKSSSIKLTELGSRRVVGDRVFRYAKCGSSTVPAAGELVETQGEVLNAVTGASTAGAAGGKTFYFYAATAIVANTYAEGYIMCESGTAGNTGFIYKIKSHPAITALGTGALTLYDPLVKAEDITDVYKLQQNPYVNVCRQTAGNNHLCVGVAPITVTTGDYFWIQTWGPCGVKSGAVTAAGETMVPAATGEVLSWISTASAAIKSTQVVGYSMSVITASCKGMVFLTIAP